MVTVSSQRARVNQQPPMHQLVVLSTGWAPFFYSASDGVLLQSISCLFAGDHCTFFFWFVLGCFFLGPNLTHRYPTHLPTLLNIVPTLVPYQLSPTNKATLITSYPTDLTIILTTYPTILATLLITYHTDLTSLLT